MNTIDYDLLKSKARKFGKKYGWKLSDYLFSVDTLAKRKIQQQDDRFPVFGGRMLNYFDHAYFYRKNRRAAAIAVHLYHIPEDLSVTAAKFGLSAKVIDDVESWWNPGETRLVLYTPLMPEETSL